MRWKTDTHAHTGAHTGQFHCFILNLSNQNFQVQTPHIYVISPRKAQKHCIGAVKLGSLELAVIV